MTSSKTNDIIYSSFDFQIWSKANFFHFSLGSLVGAIGVVIGLYILLWGKAKDTAENKEEISNPKLQNSTDMKQVVDVLEKDCCKIDLEEPLLSDQSVIGSSERYKSWRNL